MKNLPQYFIIVLMMGLLFTSCSDSDDPQEPNPNPGTEPVVLKNEVNEFVWRGMNAKYFWQSNVTNLADTKNDVQDSYYNFLNAYNNPSDLFDALIYQPGETDRFSWFINDYAVQQASFRGVSDSFGFEFGLVTLCNGCEEVLGFVTYVVPNSPAADANIKRGDLFYKFDGTVLDVNNYSVVNAYYNENNISLGLATIEDGTIVPAEGDDIDLEIREVIENPVFHSSVIDNNGTKVGYLVYNGFKHTFHSELNDVFGNFKSEGVQEVILDFRYNGGGSVLTSAYLASMIYGEASGNDVFAKLIHNSKNSADNDGYPFFSDVNVYDPQSGEYTHTVNMNRLTGISRVFVITSDDTASASEMIINGLKPYMEVITVGTTTYGKNVGSYTVYDSPDFTFNNVNVKHTMAMQPITFKIFNANDESDYTHGFEPNLEVIEYVSDMKPFGDLSEPLLASTLSLISGDVSKVSQFKDPQIKSEQIYSSKAKRKFSKEMYIINDELMLETH